MVSAFSRIRGELEDDLEAQVARLSKEVAVLRKALSRHGAHAYDDARENAADLYSDLRERLSEALPMMRRQTRWAGDAARQHPATAAVVGLVVVGLLAALLARQNER